MHYLFVHSAREWSGIARAFTTAARALAARGHLVTFAVEPESTVEQIVSEASVAPGGSSGGSSGGSGKPRFHVEPCSLEGTWMGAAGRLGALARYRKVDVVFVHTDREHLVASIAYRFGSHAPIVRRVPDGRTVVLRRSGRVATWLAPTCFMFANEQDARATLLPRRARGSFVAPLGVQIPNDMLEPVPPPIDYRDRNYILCVHDASARSKAATAIRTVAMLAPRHPDLQLVITGEGGYEDDLRMQAAALNVLHLISFLGERADELDVMRQAKLGWVVADSDTAAYGILDLMSLGVPVLGGEESVAERYILPDITGVLVPPDDAYRTAASVSALITNEEQRAVMGDAARTRVAREFPESRMIDGFERAADAVRQRR